MPNLTDKWELTLSKIRTHDLKCKEKNINKSVSPWTSCIGKIFTDNLAKNYILLKWKAMRIAVCKRWEDSSYSAEDARGTARLSYYKIQELYKAHTLT